MSNTFAILGAGMQGTAAAFDLARFAGAGKIILADLSLEQAERSSQRVNGLVGRPATEACELDVTNTPELQTFLTSVDVVLSCVPYWMHPKIASVAIAAKTSMCDLGGNTDVTWKTLAHDEEARKAGVTLVPDCGLAPGLVNSLALYLLEHLDETDTIKLFCGVLPQHPKPPFNYKLTFNVEGLVTEYDYRAQVLRDGRLTYVDTLAELEEIDIAELGRMEAFTTSGGSGTSVTSLQGKVKNYDYKTIRFPGHCERMRIFKDFGFWGEEPIDVKGVKVAPKDVFNKVFGKSLGQIQDTDQCAVRAVGDGKRNGNPTRLQIDLFDKQCETTGFTSMERLTGFSLSIYAQQVAAGKAGIGCVRYEDAMTGTDFVAQLERRGIKLRFDEQTTVGA
ncbi:MAG TPA: saccharopine dehydrogenase C-terminal domain-containing protein [Fimbriimonas sp.]|nr:saccharopine dehydrogenase C-terminal domain-containing protein [Fimbriimonas sp.]